MGDTFHCGDNAALVGYLYDEGDARERAEIAAHLAVCSDCAAEVADLSATRQQLSAWTPPEAQLDFRLTSGAAAPPARWWSNPLPAWAQLAAAAVIFAFGIALGAFATRPTAWGAMSSSNEPAINHTELTRLEQRVRNIESKSAVPVALDDASRHELIAIVREQVYESEARNQRRFAQAMSKLTGTGLQEVTQVDPNGFGVVPAGIGARFGQRREE
jgi:anti-sigma factor RsiW